MASERNGCGQQARRRSARRRSSPRQDPTELEGERTIPDFEPSPESYALAIEVVERSRAALADAGLVKQDDFDLWTALVAGLAVQQLANDPGGKRWLRLVDRAVDMYADHVLGTSTRTTRRR